MENAIIRTQNTDSLAHVGETIGKLDELTAMIAELLGDNFRATLPASDHDAAILLDWLKTGKKAESEKTRREYLRDWCDGRTGFLTFTGSKPLANVTRQDVQGFREAIASIIVPATVRRAEHSLSAATRRRMLASIKGLFSHGSGIGVLRFNPAKGVSLPSLPQSKRKKALNHEQSLQMLVTAQAEARGFKTEKRRKIGSRDYLLNKLCYLTGGRISEVLALCWKHVYQTDKGAEIQIEHGKGDKERTVGIPGDLFHALQEMREARRAGDDEFVFVSRKGGRLSPSQAWRIVSELAKRAGVEKKVSPHTLRHSVATQLLDRGVPLHQVSLMLGHSDPKITVQSYYTQTESLNPGDVLGVK